MVNWSITKRVHPLNGATLISLQTDGVPYKEYSLVNVTKNTAVLALMGRASMNNVLAVDIKIDDDLIMELFEDE